MASWVTTASNELEADMILARLGEAGVRAWPSSSVAAQRAGSMQRDIYVEEADRDRAIAALAAAEEVDEGELTRLAEEAGPPPPG